MSRELRQHTFGHVRPAKTQISQCIRADWSEYLLGAFWIAKGAKFLTADNKDWSARAQTDLIFVGRTCQQIRFLTMRFNIVSYCFLNTSLPKFFPYYYQSNQFPENYHSGSYFGLSPSRVNYLATSPVTKANQIEPVLRELSPGLMFWTIFRPRDQIVTSIYCS